MKQKHKQFLSWTAFIYIMFALILLPWTFYMSQSLPAHHISIHWDISWIGLDIALIAVMLATGILAYLDSRWVVITATLLGTMLLLDAWFDILGQHGGDDFRQAVLLAIFIEIPIAIGSFVVASRALTKNDVRIMPKRQAKTKSRQRTR